MAITGSSVGRHILCPGLRTLPELRHDEDAGEKPQLTRGTACHKFLEDAFNLKSDKEALLKMEPGDTRDFCASLDASVIIPAGMQVAEQSWAYKHETGDVRVLGQSLERKYVVEDGEIAGTADAVFHRHGLWGVADYKFTDFDIWAPPPQKSGQLKFLGLCLMAEKMVESVILQTIRIGSTGKVQVEEWVMDLFAAAEFEASLKKSLVSKPVFQEGAHCNGCNAFRVCPAKTSLLRAALVESHEAAMHLVITEETAPKLVQVLEDLDDLLKFYQKELKEYAKDFPIQMPNGDVYGPTYKTYRTIADIPQAMQWLTERYGKEKAEQIITRKESISQESLVNVIGRRETDSVMQQLSNLGYVSVRETKSVGLHAAKKT